MTRYLCLLILTVLSYPSATWADDAKENDRILKLFRKEFVRITPGKGRFPAEFKMGSTDAWKNEKPVHTVKLKTPFSIAKYEVTQELYQTVMGNNPSKWKGNRNSVEMVNWKEANEFCQKVTKELRQRKLIGEKQTVRLPTEAEWEYTCRAGTTTPYSFADAEKINDYGWHKGNSKGEDPPVGAKKPNPWGLYDVHGYLWEWCLDNYHGDYQDAPTDGSARVKKGFKGYVVRSGAWNELAERCRSASRESRAVDYRDDAIGFRCVLTD